MYRNFADVARACAQRGIGPAQLFLESECRLTERAPDEVRAQLRARWAVMEASARQALEAPQRTAGGLIDGMAHRQWTYAPGQSLCGPFLNRVMARALSCSEVNASMGRICAAPTAGACGVLPAVLVSLQEERGLGWEALEGALLVASGFGAVVMRNATVAGAEGGCQAEVGTASAMAAASSVYLMGGSPEQCFAAAGLAIQNMLGLVCDPIAGLVEAPCQARNAAGASNALVSAELVLAGVPEVIPFDEVVEAARQVGHALPESLRETALGGIAATPTACRLAEQTGCGSCCGCG